MLLSTDQNAKQSERLHKQLCGALMTSCHGCSKGHLTLKLSKYILIVYFLFKCKSSSAVFDVGKVL
jgi:hypothetical protein